MQEIRKSDQYILPLRKPEVRKGEYDIYPSLNLDEGKIEEGIESLVRHIANERTIIIDGYIGVFYDKLKEKFSAEIEKLGKKVFWHNTDSA